MKILTLNTHSLSEENYSLKLKLAAEALSRELPDVIAFQEVCQSCDGENAGGELYGFKEIGADIPVKRDNHAYSVARLLALQGKSYCWTWLPFKKAYGRYDEGVALLSRTPIERTAFFTVSAGDDHSDWRTRKILGINTAQEWFFSVHYGRWDDTADPFSAQWERTLKYLDGFGRVWLMGDFNAPAHIKGESNELMDRSDFRDSFWWADVKDSGFTVEKSIDGWKDREAVKMRIDQLRCRGNVRVKSSRVIFNGIDHPVVSDHYGVMAEYERI